MSHLTEKRCVPCEGGVPTLTLQQVEGLLKQVPGWETDEAHQKIFRKWKFKNFIEALAFVNKVGEIAEQENHHPDIELGYGRVRVELWTHAINGLSENDFIVAAKVNAIKI